MSVSRREVLKAGGGAAVVAALTTMGFVPSTSALAAAWNEQAFKTKSIAETLKALGVDAPADAGDKVTIVSPEIAENGSVVPVSVESSLPNVSMVAVMVEKNPAALAGMYNLTPDAGGFVRLNVKMGQSSDVYALVKSDNKFFLAKKEVKVTLGGCGG